MGAPALADQLESREFAELLQPEPLALGLESEKRVIHCGISWSRYLALDKKLGDNRPGPRFYYLDEALEIMTTSNEHERIKKWIADLLAVLFEISGMEVIPRGQATLRSDVEQVGAEPDESWCLNQEKEFPDLVLEIALTSGGISKLDIYRQFGVPEVWLWRRDHLEFHVLDADGANYSRQSASRLLPVLSPRLLEECVAMRSWQEARKTFRKGLENAGS